MKRLSSPGNPTSSPRNKQSFNPMKWFVILYSRKKSQTLIHHHCTHYYVTARTIISELCCSHRKAAAGALMTCPFLKKKKEQEVKKCHFINFIQQYIIVLICMMTVPLFECWNHWVSHGLKPGLTWLLLL